MNPQKNMDIALVYRKANGKTYPLCTVKNSVEPGSTLYYKYSGTGTFRPMTENEIRKIQYNSVDKKSLLKTSQPRILADNAPAAATDGNIQPSGKVEKAPKSDVDISIPTSSVSADNTFAVIIANENYSCVSKVDFALNDGSTFSQYCNKTLGLPQKHIIMCKDATYGAMEAALARISHIGTAYSGDLNIIFYYAGHGIPDEKTRDSFLIPVDGDGSLLSTCFRTSSVYKRLADINAKSVVVFMDACFSGSVRGEGMLASARGVRIAAKDDQVGGNMVVFTAAHGDETAYPYAEQEHGLFTYYLLKKIQSTSGKATLGDLMDYVTSSVMRESVVSCGRTQTPTVISSTSSADWRNWNLCNF